MNKIVNFLGKPRTIENVIKNRKILGQNYSMI